MRALARRIVAIVATLVVAVGLLALLIAWSGVYNVAASRGHFAVVEWFLRFGMENSIETHAPSTAPPPLDDVDRIQLGAAHFHSVCADCHGAPGVARNPAQMNMLPPPPVLDARVLRWKPQELFFIVKHGIKYTGMPAWPAQTRDDEVWSVVAFLRRLPALDAVAYRDLALAAVVTPSAAGGAIAQGAALSPARACARCHGDDAVRPPSARAPQLNGQPVAMLAQALTDYASGRRQSGFMQSPAAELSPQAIAEVARYYSELKPHSRRAPGDAALIDAGRRLATSGDGAARAPACLSCHTREAHPLYPRLAGQSAVYLSTRLRALRSEPAFTATQAVMAPIARRLDDAAIEAAAAYFESLDPNLSLDAQGAPRSP